MCTYQVSIKKKKKIPQLADYYAYITSNLKKIK